MRQDVGRTHGTGGNGHPGKPETLASRLAQVKHHDCPDAGAAGRIARRADDEGIRCVVVPGVDVTRIKVGRD